MHVGDIIDGTYQILALVAKGGMGSVFRARHLRIGRDFALKTLHADMVTHPDHVTRFWREAKAAASIGSDHIINVTDMGTTQDGEPYLVMEYLDGEDLDLLLKRQGPLEPQRAVELVLQACEGLMAAHERGIVHRDLKPANLFLTRHEDGTEWIKILDFGIAKYRDALAEDARKLTGKGMALGTTYYMPPEQATCADEVDHRADIYAAGVLLYELTTGKAPFTAKSFPELVLNIVSTDPVPPRQHRPDLDPELEKIILRAMARKPRHRYASMAELAQELVPFAQKTRTSIRFLVPPPLTGAPTRARSTGQRNTRVERRSAHVPTTPRSRWAPVLGAAVGISAGLALALLLAWRSVNHVTETPSTEDHSPAVPLEADDGSTEVSSSPAVSEPSLGESDLGTSPNEASLPPAASPRAGLPSPQAAAHPRVLESRLESRPEPSPALSGERRLALEARGRRPTKSTRSLMERHKRRPIDATNPYGDGP